MSKTVATLDQHSSVALPPEALDALGIEAGAELEVEIVGRALVVRSVEEAPAFCGIHKRLRVNPVQTPNRL